MSDRLPCNASRACPHYRREHRMGMCMRYGEPCLPCKCGPCRKPDVPCRERGSR